MNNDMSLPEGETCFSCAHFSFCTHFGVCDSDSTECDWCPSRFKYAGGFVKGTLQKIGSKDGRVFEVTNIKMRLDKNDTNPK